ncbi:hypothetical protein FIN92_05755 [Prevotella brunnea]|uniref:hypothetical protein n=1 Tax=Prevotella brunnea TaxID=2508867 RepID=UPI00281B7B61|nr:hypothetical protein [Prevotella brunnea]MDR0186087.1 hypothetical protein [Prevotella brunnea]
MMEAAVCVAMLLFANNRGTATAMSKSCDGDGSSLESGYDNKDDEDDWKFAHRYVLMIHSMCKTKPRHRGFHR